MKAFSIKNDKTYSSEYYALIYDVFITETIEDAYRLAREKLNVGHHYGKFELEEHPTFYHSIDDKICGELEPIKTCYFSPYGWGIVYKCLGCGKEIDSSQLEFLSQTAT